MLIFTMVQVNNWVALFPIVNAGEIPVAEFQGYTLRSWTFNTFKPLFSTLTFSNDSLQPIIFEQKHKANIVSLLLKAGAVYTLSTEERVSQLCKSLIHDSYDGTPRLLPWLQRLHAAGEYKCTPE